MSSESTVVTAFSPKELGSDTGSVSVSELLTGDVKLAAPPEIFLRINALLDDPKHTQQQLVRLIEHDPALSARLLKIVNSPFYGLAGRIDSVAKAVGLVGVLELRDLVLATLVVDRFSTLPNGLMPMHDFWAMSVRCALIARTLAVRRAEGGRPQFIFVCGLLHEIGRLVLYYRLPDLARAALLRSRYEHITEHEAQRREIGLDHYQVGAELARRWRLPEAIVVTIARHTQPEVADAFLTECRLVRLACDLGRDEEGDAASSEEAGLWTRLDISSASREEVLAEAAAAFHEVFRQIYPPR